MDPVIMDAVSVERVRRFNRTVTQRVGALNDDYLSRSRPLGQSRVLWEIGARGQEVRTLRSRLDLDSGYLSRLLRDLEADGLVTVDVADADGRVRRARLTPAGLAERDELDRLSDELAESMLLPLDGRQRDRLVAAMGEVERLLVASMVRVAVTDPRHPDARDCIQAYFDELADRFEGGFDVDRALAVADEQIIPPAGLLLVARLHGDPVGCGALLLHDDRRATIKRMWISPAVRGLGLGRRLLLELESRAAAHGAHTVQLDTNRALTEAIALYRSAGYTEVGPFNDEPHAHHWFARPLAPPAPLPADRQES